MKRVCVLLCGLALLTCCQSAKKSKYVSSAFEAAKSTEQIIINNQGSGSAFFLGFDKNGMGLWGTAKHCVQEMKPNGMFYNITMNGKECEIVVTSVKYDIAIFRVKTDSSLKPFRFAKKYPSLADLVFSCGWHFGYEETFSAGRVSKVYDDAILHTSPMNPGCSGGPTLSGDGSFSIIGVNSQILTMYGGWNGVSYSVKGHLLQELFEYAQQL